MKVDKSHIPAPITVQPVPPPREHPRVEREHGHGEARPPASMIEDKRWEMPCTD